MQTLAERFMLRGFGVVILVIFAILVIKETLI